MFILGDVAVATTKLQLRQILDMAEETEIVLFNLEGALIRKQSGIDLSRYSKMLYNDQDILAPFLTDKRIVFGLCNNHIFDCKDLGLNTLGFLTDNRLNAVGAKTADHDFSSPKIIEEGGVSVAIITGGWKVIGCEERRHYSVDQLDPRKLIRQVSDVRPRVDRVIVYMHWGYELEIYPHPADRSIARALVDAGADLVAGCHAHCVLGHESYKGKSIFYGVGNFAFSENYYFQGKLKFPDICRYGLCVRYDLKTERISLFWVDNSTGLITPSGSVSAERLDAQLRFLSEPFCSDLQEYEVVFRKMRRKRMALPVFKTHENSLTNHLKIGFLKIRGSLIRLLMMCNLKGGPK